MDAREARKYIIKTLKATKREGIEDLLLYMEDLGFFEAPASGGNHLCCDGGLCVHTANVMQMAEKLGKIFFGVKFPDVRNSLRIAAGLHDLGKCGREGHPYYVENLVKDGRPSKAEPEQKWKRSESKPFEISKELCYIDHPLRSVELATRYIDLTEDELHAIYYHDALYSSMAYWLKGHERPLQTCLHYADFWCSQFEEEKTLPKTEPAPVQEETLPESSTKEAVDDDDELPFA